MKRATTSVSLYRLIYRSREAIAEIVPDAATEPGLRRELRAIVAAARRRNESDNVTGALWFSEAGFAQVLEGSRDVVERTFERIAADRRHADVTVLTLTPAQQRSFPDWPMAFYGRTPLIAADPPGVAADSGVLSGQRVTTGSEVLRLLERAVLLQQDAWIGA